MRWNTLGNRDLHPIHWVWIWAPAALLLILIGISLGVEWLEKQKRQFMGPSPEWRPWIAWYPVRVESGKTAWLEWTERRIQGPDWTKHRTPITTGTAGKPGAET